MNLDVLDSYGPFLGRRESSMTLALRSLIGRQAPVVVELGTSRSFVDGNHEGVMKADRSYWNPDRPQVWDWGAGIFSRVCGETIAGTDAVLHSVDPFDDAIQIARTMTADVDAQIEFHQTTSTEFLANFERPIDLLYMDHDETHERGALLHLDDARLVIDSDLMAPDGVIVVDDVHVRHRFVERAIRLGRRVMRRSHCHHGKGKYSIPYLVANGFRIQHEGYQVVLGRSG